MNRTNHSRWVGAVLSIGMMLLALALPARALAHGPVDGGANADAIKGLFNITLWIAIPIFLLVEGLLLFAIVRYRRRSHDEMPDQVDGNRSLEITWTVLSFVIIAVLFALTFRALRTDYQAKAENGSTDPDFTVHVTGYMFNWDFEYFTGDEEETGVTTTRDLKIPANRNVLLEITSRDVQHSFWVPKLAGKVDAIPGHTNTMWLNVAAPGHYTGQCAEYCGLNHYNMLINLDVLEPAEFDTWLAKEVAAANEFVPIGTDLESELPDGDAARGQQMFTDLGCTACHGENDQSSGPGLSRIMGEASKRAGYTPDQFIRESILQPCAYLAEGYDQCIMPQDYGERLDAQGLADLIEFIESK